LLKLERIDNRGEEKGDTPVEGDSESEESMLPLGLFPRIFFLCLFDRKNSSLGVPMPKLNEVPPIMLAKKPVPAEEEGEEEESPEAEELPIRGLEAML